MDIDAIKETIEVKADHRLMWAIWQSEQEIRQGKTYSADEAFEILGWNE